MFIFAFNILYHKINLGAGISNRLRKISFAPDFHHWPGAA